MVRLKAETGARVASRPRYGYMKDPADPKRHMVPDPETAPVVRYIFDLCVSGKGPSQIAKHLKKDDIPHSRLSLLPEERCGTHQRQHYRTL
ncbi:MAG: recombinase family protein [Firmicutes bacterium]|nr:recombinase family protein [Bacillota bacterium]